MLTTNFNGSSPENFRAGWTTDNQLFLPHIRRAGSSISGSSSVNTSTTAAADATRRCCLFCGRGAGGGKRRKSAAKRKNRSNQRRSRSRSRSREAQQLHSIARPPSAQETFRCQCGYTGLLPAALCQPVPPQPPLIPGGPLRRNSTMSTNTSFRCTRTGSLLMAFRRQRKHDSTASRRGGGNPIDPVNSTGLSAAGTTADVFDNFRYCGIPLQASVSDYEFLRLPNNCSVDTSHAISATQQCRAVILAVGKKEKSADNVGSPSSSAAYYDSHLRSQRNVAEMSGQNSSTEELHGIVRVQLRRYDGEQLGLGITGGFDKPFPPSISYLRPGFIAHRSDLLQVGDRLTRVNGIAVNNLTHNEIMALLRNAGSKITLDLEYDLNAGFFRLPAESTERRSITEKCTDVVLINDNDSNSDELQSGERIIPGSGNGRRNSSKRKNYPPTSYGITIRGGAYGPDESKARPITIVSIRQGGPAHREGRLRVGDRILAIDGVDVVGSTLAFAQNLLHKSRGSVQITIAYDVAVLDQTFDQKGGLLLEIEKTPGVHFGVILSVRRHLRSSEPQSASTLSNTHIVVEKVVPATVADRCGAVHVGDEIQAIDGVSLEHTSLPEAYQLLKSQCNILRLEIVPFDHESSMSTVSKTRFHPTTNIISQRAYYCDYIPLRDSKVQDSCVEDRTDGKKLNKCPQRPKSEDRVDPNVKPNSPRNKSSQTPPATRRKFSASTRLTTSMVEDIKPLNDGTTRPSQYADQRTGHRTTKQQHWLPVTLNTKANKRVNHTPIASHRCNFIQS